MQPRFERAVNGPFDILLHVFSDRNQSHLSTNPLRVRRFLNLERNYAYTWFTRDIIGIYYFSTNKNVNETNIDDSVQPSVFPEPVSPTSFNSHSWGNRHHADSHFAMTKTLWTTNALGFQTAQDFAPFAGEETYQLERKSWADMYIYTI